MSCITWPSLVNRFKAPWALAASGCWPWFFDHQRVETLGVRLLVHELADHAELEQRVRHVLGRRVVLDKLLEPFAQRLPGPLSNSSGLPPGRESFMAYSAWISR